jgi:hypothetical protein
VIGVVVFALTTVLTGTEPGRAATETAVARALVPGQPTQSLTMIPFDLGSPAGRGKVQIVPEPGRVGRDTVQAVVHDPDGSLIGVPELRLTFTTVWRKAETTRWSPCALLASILRESPRRPPPTGRGHLTPQPPTNHMITTQDRP